MKALLQRCKNASVSVNSQKIGKIDRGILVFAGIQKHDDLDTVQRMADKLLSYRIFTDTQGKMNLNVKDIRGGVLVVSQFTLSADTSKGLRPSFSSAAAPDLAKYLYDELVKQLKEKHNIVATGQFAADMQVSLTNDGPVTFLLEN